MRASVNFYLKNPNAETSPVVLVIRTGGKTIKEATGVFVKTAAWRRPKKGRQYPTEPIAAAKLDEIECRIKEVLPNAKDIAYLKQVAQNAIKGNPTPICPKRQSFFEVSEEWVKEARTDARQRRAELRTLRRMLPTGADWETIDTATYLSLVKQMDAHGYAKNYQGTIIAKLKAIMNRGFMLKYHTNTDYRSFKKFDMTGDSIALTQEEVDKLWHLKLYLPEEKKARDLFIAGVYTAARFSDYSRLTKDNISADGNISFIQAKTGSKVIIPAASRLLQILERNGGSVPHLSMAVFNRTLKKVCKKAGLIDTVILSKSRGAKTEEVRVPKYEAVSSHTARRTGCTLLYLSGVPTRRVMMISGHQTEAAFFRYIRVTQKQNAELLSSNPFFTKK